MNKEIEKVKEIKRETSMKRKPYITNANFLETILFKNKLTIFDLIEIVNTRYSVDNIFNLSIKDKYMKRIGVSRFLKQFVACSNWSNDQSQNLEHVISLEFTVDEDRKRNKRIMKLITIVLRDNITSFQKVKKYDDINLIYRYNVFYDENNPTRVVGLKCVRPSIERISAVKYVTKINEENNTLYEIYNYKVIDNKTIELVKTDDTKFIPFVLGMKDGKTNLKYIKYFDEDYKTSEGSISCKESPLDKKRITYYNVYEFLSSLNVTSLFMTNSESIANDMSKSIFSLKSSGALSYNNKMRIYCYEHTLTKLIDYYYSKYTNEFNVSGFVSIHVDTDYESIARIMFGTCDGDETDYKALERKNIDPMEIRKYPDFDFSKSFKSIEDFSDKIGLYR